MAESLTGSQFFATYFSAQKPFLLLPIVSLHYPALIRRRRRRKSLHIAFCSTPTSPNLDVISTHEHSDGTVLFRFGDPSESAKEDELEESLLGVEEGGRDSEEESSVVNVLDGDNEGEARCQVATVAADADVFESVATNNKSDDFVEKETGLSENFLEDSVEELGSVSPVGFQDESVAEVSSENAELFEEISENKDDSEASFTPLENSFPSLEVEEKMRGQSSDESFEGLDNDKSLLLGSPATMPENSDTINTKEVEESKGGGSSQLTENGGDKDCHDDSVRLVENGATLSEIEAAGDANEIIQQTEQISENIDPIMEETTDSAPDGINLGVTETVVDEISPENASEGINLEATETVVDEISPENASEEINLGYTETVVDEISPENASEGINLGYTETVVDEISPENASEGINLGDTETVVDEISPENAPDGIDLGKTETVVDEISSEYAPDVIDLGNTETVVDEISSEYTPDGTDLGKTETVIDEISSENPPDGIDLGNTETVVDEIRSENGPDGIDLGNTETVVDEISSENAPDVIDMGNTEIVVDEINPAGNTETVADEISPENADIKHLSMDAEDQSIEVHNFENDDQTEPNNLSVVTEDQASQNSSFDDSGQPNVIEVVPDSPKPEAEPILDEEVDHDLTSEYDESESPLQPDEISPSISLEVERKDVENTEIIEVSGHEVVEHQSSEVLNSSKEATSAAEELTLSSGATLLQYPSKAFAGGHEAYFIACGKWLGVADGVGSWSLDGSDSGVYAQELMQNSESIVSQCDKDIINDPKQVLELSVSKTDSPGSSTILIAHFDGKALHVANIGDSGFIVVRNGSVYRKSSPMLHEFNFPVQIEKGDDPSQLLEEYKILLDEGDIIVTATDALFDNLYDQEIVSIVSKSLEAAKSPQEIAEILATRVQQVGSSASGRSPFADAAQAAGYVGYTGGKPDDVAVIVSVVQKVIVSKDY